MYRVSNDESTFPCIELKSCHPHPLPIAAYSIALDGYDALAFHTERTTYGHSVLVALPTFDDINDLAKELALHPLSRATRQYAVEQTSQKGLSLNETVERWIRSGARRKIIVRQLPPEDERMANAVIG